jgi:hypothetical protein
MAVSILLRRGTAAEWSASNPILLEGEVGIETDTKKLKVGDGLTVWASTPYITLTPAAAASLYATIANPTFTGTVSLDTGVSLVFEGATANAFETTVQVADPTADRTLTLPDSTGTIATQEYVNNEVGTHGSDTTSVHGIADTSALATKTYADTAVSTHSSDTTDVHGITDTSVLVTTNGTQTLTNKTITAPVGLTKSDVGLGNVDNTTDANKPVSTATQTALDAKLASATAATTYAPLANPTFTGTVSGVTKSHVGLGDVDNTSDANKPVSTAQQTALDLKANLAGPTFTGTVVLPSTTSVGDVSATELGYVNGVTSAIQTQLDDKLSKTGGTMTGAITLSGAPTSDLHAATKLYVDNVTAGLNFHEAVHAATTLNLATIYNNGTSGVGATLTADTNRAMTTIDGETVVLNERVLVKNQTDAKQNGIYVLTTLGSVSVPWVLTRATDADNNPTGEMKNGDFTFVQRGTVNASIGFINNSATNPIVIGTDNITYTEFNAGKTVVAGDGLTEATPGTISVASGGVTSAMIADGTIVDGDINASAAIAQSKISGLTAALGDKAPLASPTFTGTVTLPAAGIVFSDGTQALEGVPSRTPIIQKTASYTLSALTERDDLIEMSSASAMTLTIPTDATINFPIGTSLDVLQTSTGQVTIAGAGGVTVNATPGLKLRTTWSSATLFKRAANTWVVFGDLSA